MPGGRLAMLLAHPAALLAALMLVTVLAVAAFAARHDPTACKAAALEERLERQRQFAPQPSTTAPRPAPGLTAPTTPSPGRGVFGDLFAPGNLQPGAPADHQPP